MSPLSPKRRIALLPGLAALAAGRESVEETAGSGWDGSLAALAAILKQRPGRGPATIVLSQHFVRLFLLPPPAAWLNRSELQTWLADRLGEALGGIERWQLDWQDVAPGRPVPVCAIERPMLESLRTVLADAGLKPNRIEPWPAVAFNRREPVLRRATGWYALLEPGLGTLMRLERGRIVGLRQRQLGPDPADELRRLIGRESLINGVAAPGELWLDSGGVPGAWQGLAQAGLPVRELPVSGTLQTRMLAA